MRYVSPEQVGVTSENVMRFYRRIEEQGISMHSVILAKGDAVFSECYYAPFHKDFLHRMYSVSKTFVATAIGCCLDEGLLALSDTLEQHFPEYMSDGVSPSLRKTTVEELLKMETAVTGEDPHAYWFAHVKDDRAAVYFKDKGQKNANTLFLYDSSGSYLLGAIVEKLTGKPFLTYLKDKILRNIGFSEDAFCLDAAGKYSWGDSGVMCRAYDLLLFARFWLNGGTWEGKRYLSEDFVTRAVSPAVCTSDFGFSGQDGTYGYGYQIWGARGGGFAMRGMGGQVALCLPKEDLILVTNADTQGHPLGYYPILDAFYTEIVEKMHAEPLPENAAAERALRVEEKGKKLFFLQGAANAAFAEKINGKHFVCEENPMGIRSFTLRFDGEGGTLSYENATGEKSFPFGLGHNEIAPFPEEGYSARVGGLAAAGHKYTAAFSADFPEEKKLRIRVQIIDEYFGNLAMVFGFRDENTVSVRMQKVAENFLNEYVGTMNATAK
ncbi:MAG: serine hydrolase [Clostridia bacterium]|nr:serine hydrolase [Clostridia bacterium]